MLQKGYKYKGDLFLIFLCIVVLIPVFCISHYNRPSADDYDYARHTYAIVKSGGGLWDLLKAALETSRSFYNSWQGLYTSAFLLSLQPGIFGEQYYRYASIILIAVCFALLWGTCRIMVKHSSNPTKLHAVSFSCIILTFILLWMPSPTEGLFWFNGAMNYTPWVFADLLNICLIYDAYRSNTGKVPKILFSTVLSFIISGANHVTAFANILYLLAAVILLIPRKKYYAILPFVSACIGFLIMYFAPGTAVRQSALVQQSVLMTIFRTLRHLARNLVFDWLNIDWLLLLVLSTPFAVSFAKNSRNKVSLFDILVCAVICFTVICGMMCVPFYAMGSFGDPRVENVYWCMFIFQSILIYILIWSWLIHNGRVSAVFLEKHILSTKARCAIPAICLVLLLFTNNVSLQESSSLRAWKELKANIPQAYCQELEGRYEIFHNPDISEAAVPPLQNKSPLLFLADFSEDPTQWPNTSISQYYNKAIYLRESE